MALYEYEKYFDEILKDNILINNKHHYTYIIEKASQLGLIKYVDKILKLNIDQLDLSNVLYIATAMGHYDIIKLLLDYDYKNEENIKVKHLTHLNLLKAIEIGVKNKHEIITKLLENYYFRTYSNKNKYNKNKILLPHQQKMEDIIAKKALDDLITATNIDTEIQLQNIKKYNSKI